MDVKTAVDPAHLIAVVGMAGRFPGAHDADDLWSLLMGRGDAIRPVPDSRWDTSRQLDPEKSVQDVGGFIDGVDRFDAAFFGVSPREAAAIDPQQRLMLEMNWRALEDAGARASLLGGTRTGVYVGASWHDYELLRNERAARPTPHSLVGNALDVIAARVSYFLGLRGPSMAVETGCSSSLVALHLAAQALRSGEIEAALVGGTNLILHPHVTVGLTHFGGLSPDGRCKTFAASANGFVRGEGVAALYVKTLERALRDGDRIHAVVVRTVVNNDGGGDSLVTPSHDGQVDLLRQTYGDGAVPAGAPAYIEAHGTGTGRGDPIEAAALGSVLGRGRGPGNPLHIGSVKTNIGHLEASAGMAGLFKLMLSMRHGTVPPSLHSEELNPAIDFDAHNLRVVRDPLPLAADEPVHLGVSSFGWGGTNAHVVLMTPPAPTGGPMPARRTGLPAVVPVSAEERHLLAEHAGALASHVPDDGAVDTFAGTLAHRRDHFPERAAVVAEGPGELRDALHTLAEQPDTAGDGAPLARGRAVPHGRTAFVFPGQGSQWEGMGRELYRDSPVFADVIRRCADALRPHTDWDLLEVFAGDAGDEWTTRIDMLQPTLWAMSLGIAELWRAVGIEPDVVLGHSQGEITAATLAGILSYEDAALVMARRSAIARRASGQGRMLAVDLGRSEAEAALEGFEDSVSLAVHNGPRSCVLSGAEEEVLTLKELLDAEGTYCRLVNVDYASHSPQMDPLRDDLLEALAPARPRAGTVELMSTVRVAPLEGPEMDGAYWVENLRSPVLFADTMSALLDEGVTHVVEISPHPVLAPAVEQLAAERSEVPAVLPSMRRHQGSAADFALALAGAYTAGLEPFGGLPRHMGQTLPGYPMRSESHWMPDRGTASGAARGFEAPLAPAPGVPGSWHGAVELSVTDLPWLADHQVHGTPVLPGAAVLALAVNAVRSRTGHAPRRLARVAFRKEVALGETPARLTTELRDVAGDGGVFRLLSLPDGASAWETNALAHVTDGTPSTAAPVFPEWAAEADPVSTDEFYRSWAERGLQYGDAFRAVRRLRVHPDADQAVGEVVLAEGLRGSARPGVLHPALWDGALQVALRVCEHQVPGAALVPTLVRRIDLLHEFPEPVDTVFSHAVRRAEGLVDLYVFDASHRPLMTLEGLQLRPLPTSGRDGKDDGSALLHRVEWTELAGREPVPRTGGWALCGQGALSEELAAALTARGAEVTRVPTADALGSVTDADTVVFLAPSAEAGADAQQEGLLTLTSVVSHCVGSGVPPRLAVVTTGSQAVGADDVPDPGSALYWGYGRVLRRECPELASRLLDVHPADREHADRCAEELLCDDGEDQVAIRSGRVLGARISRGQPAVDVAAALPLPLTGAQPFRVAAPGGAGGDRAACLPLTRREPGAGEIEVEVVAAALGDAADRLTAANAPARAGSAVGRVTAVGPGTGGLSPGDRVAVCALGVLASHLTVAVGQARRVPETLADPAAAALPLAMATAWYALADLGRVEAGETVLVHADSGATGKAAAQVARVLGARVVATAADAATRAHLESLGVDEVFDPRDPHWTDEVRHVTGGRGADLMLGTPSAGGGTGPEALADDGRFVDFTGAGVQGGVAPDAFGDGASLLRVDVPGLLRRRPRRFARALASVWDLVADAKLEPLPVTTRPFAEAAEALGETGTGAGGTLSATAVFVDPSTVGSVLAVPVTDGHLRTDGTYVISGGLGGLGLSLAEFLAAHGAGGLVLLGRSAPGAEAEDRLAALRARGVHVEAARCDVRDAQAVRAALAGIRGRLPAVRGVVHAAGLLDDATISTLTARQVSGVLAPKTAGARNLEAATADDPLDFFLLFSSAAALVGNAGQAAYAAANAYLDAFAESRRRRGLPALSVQWGPFAEVGLAARDARRGARLDERGMGSVSPGRAWPALVRMLEGDEPVVAYVPIDLRRWFDAYPDTAGLGSWQWLRGAAQEEGDLTASGGAFLARLLRLEPEGRREAAEAKIRELAGRVLRLDAERVTSRAPFKSLGLDSLMSLELRNRLEAAFGVKLSPTLLWAYGNADALAGALCELLPEEAQD